VKRLSLAALAALVLGVALVASSGAASTTCVWTKHTKRVVTHVKRHGKRTRVVQVKHYRTCRKVAVPGEPTPAAPTPTTTTPAPSPPPTPTPNPIPAPPNEPPVIVPPTEPEPEANALGVAADDHGGKKSYVLSRQTVRSGRLTVQLQNKGEDPHDMEMERVGEHGEPLGAPVEVPVTAPGEQKTQSVEVEPGEYRMWCNLFHHAEEGMEATITVE
jgi:plastocyanin